MVSIFGKLRLLIVIFSAFLHKNINLNKIMTLKEKIREVEFNINDLESIAEEFAIGFVEWKDKISDSDLRYSKKYAKSNDELLKIYKTEHYEKRNKRE